MGVGSEHAGEG